MLLLADSARGGAGRDVAGDGGVTDPKEPTLLEVAAQVQALRQDLDAAIAELAATKTRLARAETDLAVAFGLLDGLIRRIAAMENYLNLQARRTGNRKKWFGPTANESQASKPAEPTP